MKMEYLRDQDVPMRTLKGHVSECKVVRVIDGDSLILIYHDIDGSIQKTNARMMGIDAPEMNATPDLAKASRNFLIGLVTNIEVDISNMSSSKDLQNLIDSNSKLLVAKFGSLDKYGRQLVELYDTMEDINVFTRSINHKMILSKRARSYDGGKKDDWFGFELKNVF